MKLTVPTGQSGKHLKSMCIGNVHLEIICVELNVIRESLHTLCSIHSLGVIFCSSGTTAQVLATLQHVGHNGFEVRYDDQHDRTHHCSDALPK